MVRLLTLAFVAGSLCLPAPAAARVVEGTVVRVKDGDSLLLRRGTAAFDRRVSEVRLAGIDAPELSQPHGRQARAALARMVEGQRVQLRITDRDRYGRIVGYVVAGGRDVNRAMVATGNAWAFGRYERDTAMQAAHDRARQQRLGLWALPPQLRMSPATWREQNPRRE